CASDVFSTSIEGRYVVSKPVVILVDEVEAHLHPKWQRTICDWLKTRFPLMQFFVTSHSPLILQAADPGWIFVLPMEGEVRDPRKLEEHEYERIVLGKAEKVLLGEAFGLSTTRGLWANQLINKFRTLDAKKRAGVLR